MQSSIEALLTELASSATFERAKGDLFERLVRRCPQGRERSDRKLRQSLPARRKANPVLQAT